MSSSQSPSGNLPAPAFTEKINKDDVVNKQPARAVVMSTAQDAKKQQRASRIRGGCIVCATPAVF